MAKVNDAQLKAILGDASVVTRMLAMGVPYKKRLIQTIHVDNLDVDRLYQRDFNEARARRMADNFNADVLGVIQVGRRQGTNKNNATDGQHRVGSARIVKHRGELAAKNGGDENLLCLVRPNSTLEVEAKDYEQCNTTVKVGGNARVKARIVHQEGNEYVIQQILEEHGFFFTFNNRGRRDGEGDFTSDMGVNGAHKIVWGYEKTSPAAFCRAIEVLKGAFVVNGRLKWDAATGEFIAGLCLLMKGLHDVQLAIRKLKDYNPRDSKTAEREAMGSGKRPKYIADKLATCCCHQLAA